MTAQITASNGRKDQTLLSYLPGKDSDGSTHQADLLAVAAYNAMRADMRAAGLGDLLPSDGYSCYRTLAEQQYMVDSGLSTAPPGTSIHGEAVAVDFASLGGFGAPRHEWLRLNAARYGWYQPAWVYDHAEPWHWEYDPDLDTHPDPIEPPEVNGMSVVLARLKTGDGKIFAGNGVVRRWVKSPAELADVRNMIRVGVLPGEPSYVSGGSTLPTVHYVDSLDWLGVEVK